VRMEEACCDYVQVLRDKESGFFGYDASVDMEISDFIPEKVKGKNRKQKKRKKSGRSDGATGGGGAVVDDGVPDAAEAGSAAAPGPKYRRTLGGEVDVTGWYVYYSYDRSGCDMVVYLPGEKKKYGLYCRRHGHIHELARSTQEKTVRPAGKWCPQCVAAADGAPPASSPVVSGADEGASAGSAKRKGKKKLKKEKKQLGSCGRCPVRGL
jgi:hypothetical protein